MGNANAHQQRTSSISPVTKTSMKPEMSSEEFQILLETFRTGPGMQWKTTNELPPVLTPNELRQMLEDTKYSKKDKIDPLIALLEDEGNDTKIHASKKSGGPVHHSGTKSKTREASKVHTIGQKQVTEAVSTPSQSKTESIRNMWGNLNPNAARFRMTNPRISTLAPRDTPKIHSPPTNAPATTPRWHRFTTKPDMWVEQVSKKVAEQDNQDNISEYIMVNGVRRRIPDNVRFRLEQRATVPPNIQREAAEIMTEVNRRNQYIKSAYGKRKR